MNRREIIAGLGSVAAWQVAAQAQQRAIPVIAFLSTRSAESDRSMVAAFRRGLNQLGFEEGRNLTVEYRFADGKYDLVPALVTELVDRRVNVIVLARYDARNVNFVPVCAGSHAAFRPTARTSVSRSSMTR